MSKKLFASQKWKAYLKQRQEAELLKLRARPRRGYYGGTAPKKKRGFLNLRVPTIFSFVKNPDEMLQFVSTLKFYGSKDNVNLDLSEISDLSTDAIAVLTATLRDMADVSIRGNQPNDPNLREMLIQSGFFQHVSSQTPTPPPTKGRISQKSSRQVEPKIARDLIHLGTKAIHGESKRCPAAYRTLIESMNNTHNHAGKSQRNRETWWSTVYADISRSRVCYTFVDTGVGIFRSVRLNPIRRTYRAIGIRDNTDILREIFEGKIQSRTGIPYRGKGLPSIYRLSQLGLIRSLVIVSNDVFANVSTGEYRMLETGFRGTLLYWETE